MNDIATASDRGRRTVYTYFRTKSEIYQAVIEDETSRIRRELEERVGGQSSPADKLRALMQYRVTLAEENRHGYEVWLNSLFGLDAKRADKIRAMVTDRIYEMIDEILTQGIESGEFDPKQAERVPALATMLVRGGDWTLMRGADSVTITPWQQQCIDFVIDAITIKKQIKPN